MVSKFIPLALISINVFYIDIGVLVSHTFYVSRIVLKNEMPALQPDLPGRSCQAQWVCPVAWMSEKPFYMNFALPK